MDKWSDAKFFAVWAGAGIVIGAVALAVAYVVLVSLGVVQPIFGPGAQ